MISSDSVRVWYALDALVAKEAREAVEYALMEAGALGTETRDADDQLLQVTGYFEYVPERGNVRTELAEGLRIYDLPSSSVRGINVREVANEDWLGEWKKNWRPVECGRFIVAPPWSDLSIPAGKILITIEPGMAFGTGTHETTRLCLAAIEKHFAGGSFLDVGTGTGILAIAAAKLFPVAAVQGIDNDASAIEIARENARLNDVLGQITFRVGTVDDTTASADFVCANLTANVINEMLPGLLGVTCGRLVLSGILDSQLESVLSKLDELAVAPIETTRLGEWCALVI